MKVIRHFGAVIAVISWPERIAALSFTLFVASMVPAAIVLTLRGYPIGAAFLLLFMAIAWGRWVEAGWRWRVRDGHGSARKDSQDPSAPKTGHRSDSRLSFRIAWEHLSIKGRRGFALRSLGYLIFCIVATAVGASTSPLLAGISLLLAAAVYAWFVSGVRSYVAGHGKGSDPWGSGT